jgi:hypothetical protein
VLEDVIPICSWKVECQNILIILNLFSLKLYSKRTFCHTHSLEGSF